MVTEQAFPWNLPGCDPEFGGKFKTNEIMFWTYGTDQDSYGLVTFNQEQMGDRSNETARELLRNISASSGLLHPLIRSSLQSLVQHLLEPFDALPAPSTPLSPLDANLMEAAKQLSRVPPNLYVLLEEDPEWVGISPLDEGAPKQIQIPSANNLDKRLDAISQKDSGSIGDLDATPEIRLETDDIPATPEISVTAPENPSDEAPAAPTTLVAPRSFGTASNVSKKHMSALVRLLYVHSCLNPAHRSPYIASLLIPLYSVLNMEIEAQDVAHAEADTFWLFETMIGEFSPLEDEAEGALWMKKLGDRVWWADSEFYTDLVSYI
jgi:hypothetical protein